MNDSFIFLLLAGVALVFKWLTRQASNERENPQAPPSPEEPTLRPPPQSEQERVRRFLEALGAPPGTEPPPPVRPRAITPRKVITPTASASRPRRARRLEQPLPPLTTVPPPPPRMEEQLPTPVIIAPLPPARLPLPALAPATAAAKGLRARASLGEMLRDRARLRNAILLREVLGPPRGLLEFDGARSL